jgi:transcriptional regulator with XRE-family HTH domain
MSLLRKDGIIRRGGRLDIMPNEGELDQPHSSKLRDETTAEFRAWLKDKIESDSRSLNSIEREAGIRGNALGKFLRGERGSGMSLTPLHIKRLAPVLGISEEMLLSRAGHLSHLPDAVSVEQAILSDNELGYEDKKFLIGFYRRMVKHE